jgi:O-acetyl-ADP-ribose deacetylase (regulator of RNase III)
MKTTKGDLLKLAQEGRFDLIAHGCNCMCEMGAGIAKGIRAQFPVAFEADQVTAKGDRAKLGTCTFASCPTTSGGRVIVVNAYTQYDYRGAGVKVDYDAVRGCMKWIAQQHRDARIGLPEIGAGLAGGDWDRIAGIIDEELRGCDVTVVEFAPG